MGVNTGDTRSLGCSSIRLPASVFLASYPAGEKVAGGVQQVKDMQLPCNVM